MISTDSYKGVRDFLPHDMAIQRHIFDTWAKTAELFGYERYDASALEPADLYRSKTSEEIVNEQTYTFTDRGGREVTLRPEMTPTVARMIAGNLHNISFPARWYSIPNCYRYERMQRGRLREFWQLNCDLFGATGPVSDAENIALAHALMRAFGADESMFSIRINNRRLWNDMLAHLDIGNEDAQRLTRLVDKKGKIPEEQFADEVRSIVGVETLADMILDVLDTQVLASLPQEIKELDSYKETDAVLQVLAELGITNALYDPTVMRGFDYYTGIVFECLDTDPQNSRALFGGGRYDNLTELFGTKPISGIGFGLGDVVMRHFLEVHELLPTFITAPTLRIIPLDQTLQLEAEKLAGAYRSHGIRTDVDLADRKLGKRIGDAGESGVEFVIVFGESEQETRIYTIKALRTGIEQEGTSPELIAYIIASKGQDLV